MNVDYVYVKSYQFEDVAKNIKQLLSALEEANSSNLILQKRYGVNYGGEYYSFIFENGTINLVNHIGDNLDLNYTDYNLYLEIITEFESNINHNNFIKKFNTGLKNTFRNDTLSINT